MSTFRMNTPAEQKFLREQFALGATLEYKSKRLNTWVAVIGIPCWSFESDQYRVSSMPVATKPNTKTKALVEVMQAYLDGAELQYRSLSSSDNGWRPRPEVESEPQWGHFEYRVAPEPVPAYFVNFYEPVPGTFKRQVGVVEYSSYEDARFVGVCNEGYIKTVKIEEGNFE